MGVASGRQARRPRRERHRVAPAVTHLGVSRCIFGAKAFGVSCYGTTVPPRVKKGMTYFTRTLLLGATICHEHASHHSVSAGQGLAGGGGGGVDSAESPGMEACELLIRACEPWSPANHSIFPAPARARAVELLCVGHHAFANKPSLLDCWLTSVMPMSIGRGHPNISEGI